MAREQDQFLDVVDRDTAERRWLEAIRPRVLEAERVALATSLGRVLAGDVITEVDVPAFDRSNVDGFAVRAEETFGAAEESPRRFRLNAEELATGVVPRHVVGPGTATPIATGGMTPRGADAVVMVEHTTIDGEGLLVLRPVAPGSGVTLRRDRHGAGRAGPEARHAPDLARDGGPGRHRPGRGRGRPPADAWRSSRRATRSSRRGPRADRRRSTTRTRRCSPTPSARSGASRSRWGSSATRRRRSRPRSSGPWVATSCSSAAGRARGPATSRTGSWRGGVPGSSSTGWP